MQYSKHKNKSDTYSCLCWKCASLAEWIWLMDGFRDKEWMGLEIKIKNLSNSRFVCLISSAQ